MIVNCILSFLVGATLMDILWAWKTGTIRRVVNMVRNR
jgi:hypothetical protein